MDDFFEQVQVDWVVVPVVLDLAEHCFSDLMEHTPEYLGFKLGKALLSEAGNGAHLHVKAVQVLEKALHPLHHHLVV